MIVESTLTHLFFKRQVEYIGHAEFDRLTVGLGKAASVILFTYFCLKLIGVAHSHNWGLLNTPYGYWFLLEILGFVLLPAFLFAYGVRYKNVKFVRWTALLTVIDIILNRINMSIVVFNWNAPLRYYPSWMEVVMTLGIITFEILAFRWIVNRMAILYNHSAYKSAH